MLTLDLFPFTYCFRRSRLTRKQCHEIHHRLSFVDSSFCWGCIEQFLEKCANISEIQKYQDVKQRERDFIIFFASSRFTENRLRIQ